MIVSVIEIFVIFILPILFWYFGFISPKYRLIVLGFVSLLALAIVLFEKTSLYQLGFRLDNFSKAAAPYLVFTAAGALAIYFLAKILKRNVIEGWKTDSHFLYGFIIVSILQEFLYRSFLIPKLFSLFSSPFVVIVANAILFSFLHIIFPERKINIPLAFLGGMALAAIYYFYPNFLLISLSHMVLNYVVVLFGFVTLSESEV